MFWADNVAKEIIDSKKYNPYWVDDMKTPSGRIHVGALRGVIVHDLVFKALKSLGKDAKYTYVFEDHDPMDEIPSYLDRKEYEKYLGMPLFMVPSPIEGFDNYARYYASEFRETFEKIGCNPEIIWTKDLYTSGKMNPLIEEILNKADKVREIYQEMYQKELPKNWYPFQVFCPNCGKVSTTNVTNWDGKEITFECLIDKVKWTKGCGEKGKISPFSSKDKMVGKLPWKVEWPAKWKAIGVTVEGAGKDHMSSGGSHDLAKLICERVINYQVPYPIAYEWILVGGRKMSSSKGVGTSAKDMLEILPPELLRFMIVRIKVNQQINFDPSEKDTIPVLFDEYQKAAEAYFNNGDKDLARIFELSQIGEEIKKPPAIRFSVLAQWVQMPNMEEEIKNNKLTEWAGFARYWVDNFAPEELRFEIKKDLPSEAKDLTDKQKKYLNDLAKKVGEYDDPLKLQEEIYVYAKENDISSKDAFQAVYKALIGKDHGPKAGWLILSLDKEFVMKRFSEV